MKRACVATLLGAVAGVTACTSTRAESVSEPPVVTVVGRDFSFEAPDSLPPGATRFRFRREGTVAHEVSIARVTQGVSLDSVMRLELAGADITGLYDPGEGLLYAARGESVDAELLVTLERGRDYVLLCTLEEKDKTHSLLGMVHGLRVIGR
jgi:hypothetical protein